MYKLPKVLMASACLLSMQACDRATTPAAPQATSSSEPLAQDLSGIEAMVRLAEANKRIDDLERQVGKLESTPEKLDLDLLTQRVVLLEARDAGIAVNQTGQPLPRQRSGDAEASGSAPRRNDGASSKPTRNSNLTLPDLEGRSRLASPAEAKARLATPAEIKAFSAGK